MDLQLKQKTYPDENEGWMDLGFFQNYVIESAETGKLELTGKKDINSCSIEEITRNKYWLLERVRKLNIEKKKK